MRFNRVSIPKKSSGHQPGRASSKPNANPKPGASASGGAASGGGSGIGGARPDRGPVKAKTYVLASVSISTLLLLFFLFADRGLLQARRQKVQLQALQTEISKLAQETEALEDEVKKLQTDPAAAEKIAREELNLVGQGDVVLVLPPGWKEGVSTPSSAGSGPSKRTSAN